MDRVSPNEKMVCRNPKREIHVQKDAIKERHPDSLEMVDPVRTGEELWTGNPRRVF